ncbi:zinc-binding dehydrogenase [Pendulispora rubella]|uniref:Zinc-binding dehydrogenase n=1 Tax=Pendulispora rubella TaxID=2741070 RepID=A0ABZ2KYG3_9BACT
MEAVTPDRGELVVEVHVAGGVAIAGTVACVGEGTSAFAVGEPVAIDARLVDARAERLIVDAQLPTSLRIAVNAYHVLVDVVRLGAGETLLIQDAGSAFGLLAVQFARVLGAGAVLGVVASEAQRERAVWAGCAAALLPHGFAAHARALTNDRGVDVVLESAMGDRVIESRKALGPLGRIAFAASPLAALLFQPATAREHGLHELATEVREPLERAARSVMAYVASGAVRVM